MEQGDIYIVNLNPTLHTEIGKTRPGLIISINAMNHKSPRLIVAPITSTTRKIYPFEVFIPRGTTGLDKDSKIMVDQLRSLDKKRSDLRPLISDFCPLRFPPCAIAQRLLSVD